MKLFNFFKGNEEPISAEINRCKPCVAFSREELISVYNLMSTVSGCNTLKSKQEMLAAASLMDYLGLPHHSDFQKDWDSLKALFYLFTKTEPSSKILDAGGGIHSPVLNALSSYGYENLYACDVQDVNYDIEKFSDKIKFSIQNIVNTNYPDHFFQAVTCLSVIEHGVNHRKFFAEMSRIMEKNGLLIITADYWPDYIDCTGIYPYGPDNSEMKIYQSGDIEDLVQIGKELDFELCSSLELAAVEKAVRWDDVDREYTFIFLALKKNG